MPLHAGTDHVADQVPITWLSMHWSRVYQAMISDWQALIMGLCTHWSRGYHALISGLRMHWWRGCSWFSAWPLCGPQTPLLAWAGPLLAIVLFVCGRTLMAFARPSVVNQAGVERTRDLGVLVLAVGTCGGGVQQPWASQASYRTSSQGDLGPCKASGLWYHLVFKRDVIACLWVIFLGSLAFSFKK